MQEMSPIDWAVRPLKRYAQFKGRASRAEYWWFWLAYMALDIVIQIVARISPIFGLLGILYLGLIIPMISVGVRRLHDTDRTGWWMLAPVFPYVLGFILMFSSLRSAPDRGLLAGASAPAIILLLIGAALSIAVFIFTVLPGTRGPNHYGSDPYDEANLEEVFA